MRGATMATSKDSPTPGEVNDIGAPDAKTAVAVEVETAPPAVEPMNAVIAPPEVHLKDIRGVRYIGTADVRTISNKDLTHNEVEAKSRDDLVWSSDNNHFVDKSEINAATLAFLLSDPTDFRAE